ncbi:hypothetical protein DBL07_04030 [Achromobacter mucicolens]|uniref:toxin VasX n=1 Tax=Achromobacter mucicolens TaxID=1389922 RepID=UPI000D3B6B73|nr:toxin VasX [Achromobacter mucicolens]PTX08319.1 hypothetical protein DBL07_04030 [Achromobacter mucicolens]
MAASTGHRSANESCKARIPLFPLRYSAHPRPKGGADYAYDAPSLETGFQKLDHAQYGLRCVGAGFVYLFDETEGTVFVWRVNEETGQFIELLSRHRSLEAALGGYKPGRSLPHIWANERSVVHILLTDTLLTERKIREIESDQDSIRAKLATTIDMRAWTDSAPARNTFPANRLGELVEEFKGTDLGFSPWRIKQSARSAQALVTGMKAVASAKQIAVVMHDNIALVQDLGGMFHKSRQAMETYNSAPDHGSAAGDVQRYRKMIVAQLIERIYESGYADKAGVVGKDREEFERVLSRDMDEREWKRKRFADNLAVIEREPARYRPSSYSDARRQLDALPTDPIGKRAAALSEAVPLYARHVWEADRVRFVRDFSVEVGRRHVAVVDRKNDRCKWLQRYVNTTSPTDTGTTFLRYDTDHPMSSTSHAIAFSACIEGMIWGTEITAPGIKDRERELFDDWWKLPWHTNPILVNIEHDKGLVDAIWENKMDIALDTAGSKGLGQLLRFGALHYLMEQVSVYALSRFPRAGADGRVWHGVARDAVADRLHQLAGTGTVEDVERLVRMLETRYQDRLTIRRLTREEAIAALEDAAGFPRGSVVVGSIAMGADDTMEVIVWQRMTPLTRYANPFLQVFERGVAGGVAFFSFLNLKAAILDLDLNGQKWKSSWTSLVAAIMGAGSATNGVLIATRALMPRVYLRASISAVVLQRIASTGSLRLFGYGGAVADAISNWFRSGEQRRVGNQEAATAYAVAGLGLGLGGAALTTRGAALAAGIGLAGTVATVPVWGWIAAGLILLGTGLWWLTKGDQAQFVPIGYWLNDGSFGKHELLGRPAIVRYETLDQENRGYVQAIYAPQRLDADWHMTSKTLIVKIIYPLDGAIQRIESEGNNVTQAQLYPMEGEGASSNESRVRSYKIIGLTKGTGFRYSIRPRYVPVLMGETLESEITFIDKDTPWYY